MRRRNRAAVVLAGLTALTLSACGPGAADAAGTAGNNADTGISAESVSWQHDTAKSNKRIMERFTSEFLPTGDPAPARKFLSPDIVTERTEARSR